MGRILQIVTKSENIHNIGSNIKAESYLLLNMKHSKESDKYINVKGDNIEKQ
jgi:hypothetical protein